MQQSFTLPLTSLRTWRPVCSCSAHRDDGKSLSSDIKNNRERKLCGSAIYPREGCQNLYYMLQGWENMYYVVGSFSADSNTPVQYCKFGYRKGWQRGVKAPVTYLLDLMQKDQRSLLSQERRLGVCLIKIYEYLH